MMINPCSIKLKVMALSAITFLLSTNVTANTTNKKLYTNEKAITFKTMGGKTTDAFEGFINVPENRTVKTSRIIPVKYVRFPATGEKIGPPIVYLSGGPGGSGIDTAKYPNFRFPLFMALREFGDVIALDQRGTGLSNTTPKCTSSYNIPLNKQHTVEEVTKQHLLAASECVKFWQSENIDLLGYNTIESAKDINALRQHFNAEKVTLWGISYGSHLALAAMKEFPQHINKVVIASAEGLNQTVKLPAETDAYFRRLQQAIDTQPEAAKHYPDIVGLMHRVHNKLAKSPIKVQVPQPDESHQEILFQKWQLQGLASAMIADPQRGVMHLLPLYRSLDVGSTEILVGLLKRGFLKNDPISFNAMSFAMDIASGISDDRLAKVNKQAKDSLLGLALNFPMPQLNKSITGLDLGDDFRKKPISDVPTLLLTGTLDGRTYINSQNEATSGLSNLTQIKVINGGHNIFMVSPEVTENIKRFLNDEQILTRSITVKLPSFAPKH